MSDRRDAFARGSQSEATPALFHHRPWLWIPVGVLGSVCVSVGLFVGIQLAVWGPTAPDWYVVPDALGSMLIGLAGGAWGVVKAERAGW